MGCGAFVDDGKLGPDVARFYDERMGKGNPSVHLSHGELVLVPALFCGGVGWLGVSSGMV